MKRFFLLLIAIVTINVTYAQTADEIINKHVEAVGGLDAWKKVNTMITTGTLKIQGADIGLTQTVVNGKGARNDITAMGMTGYEIITPTAGWKFMPFQGQKQAEPYTADDVKESQEDLDIQGNLLDYKAKGHTVEYLGTDDIDGIDAYKIKETLKSGKVETVYLDPKTYYVMRIISKRKANGQEMDVITNVSNYQKLPEGIMVPFSVALPFGVWTITKVEINKPVDENIFKPAK